MPETKYFEKKFDGLDRNTILAELIDAMYDLMVDFEFEPDFNVLSLKDLVQSDDYQPKVRLIALKLNQLALFMPSYSTQSFRTVMDCIRAMVEHCGDAAFNEEHMFKVDALTQGLFFLNAQGRSLLAHLLQSVLASHNQFFKYEACYNGVERVDKSYFMAQFGFNRFEKEAPQGVLQNLHKLNIMHDQVIDTANSIPEIH